MSPLSKQGLPDAWISTICVSCLLHLSGFLGLRWWNSVTHTGLRGPKKALSSTSVCSLVSHTPLLLLNLGGKGNRKPRVGVSTAPAEGHPFWRERLPHLGMRTRCDCAHRGKGRVTWSEDLHAGLRLWKARQGVSCRLAGLLCFVWGGGWGFDDDVKRSPRGEFNHFH